MSEQTRYERHEKLMTRMADAQGVDLDLAMLRGDLSPEHYSEAVLACTGCSMPEECEGRLAESRFDLPSFCRNGEMIERLAKVCAV